MTTKANEALVSVVLLEAVRVQAEHVQLGIACRGPDVTTATTELLNRIRAMINALQPVAVTTEEQVARATAAIADMVVLAECDATDIARAAVTAAFAPAEQEGDASPTHPGGDSREPVGIVVCVDGVTDVSWYEGPDLAPGTELVPLSALEAAEREHHRRGVQIVTMTEQIGEWMGRAETAEARLAAAEDKVTALSDLLVRAQFNVSESYENWHSDTRAALAGSNGA